MDRIQAQFNIAPNMQILLYRGASILSQANNAFSGEAIVTYDWRLGGLRYELRKIKDKNGSKFDFGKPGSALLNNLGVEAPVDIGTRNPVILSGKFSDGISIGDGNEFTEVVFHLPNFPDIQSDKVYQEEIDDRAISGRRIKVSWSPLVLKYKTLQIEIHPTPTIQDDLRELRSDGGFAITAVGRITREGGKSFKKKKAVELLEILGLFLSLSLIHISEPTRPY